MDGKKEKKLKRLRKTHIWPSVLLFLFSLFMAGAAFIAFVAVMLASQMSERMNYACANAASISSSFNTSAGNEAAILQNMQKNAPLSDAVFIYDKDGNQIAGYGELTCDRELYTAFLPNSFDELLLEMGFEEKYTIYADQDTSHNLMDQNGNLQLVNVLHPVNRDVLKEIDWQKNARLFEAKFWTQTELSENRSILVKCSAPLYTTDFAKSVLMGSLAFGVMLLPTIFFFFNVIGSILRQWRVTRLLYTDTVTAGKSYFYFEQNAGKELAKRLYRGKAVAVADITIAKYRNYCNYHGIHEGEALLERVDREISSYLGKKEICAHSGKSSFAVLLLCNDKKTGEERIRVLVKELSEKYAKSSLVFHAGIFFPDRDKKSGNWIVDPADCLGRAGAARASLTDDNLPDVAVYNDKLLEEQLWTHRVEERMQAALDREEFKVYIQPKYDPVTEELAGGEALIRWINEEDGFISPGRFIPIFENNGFITRIDDYMVSHVAKLQAEWLAEGKKVVPISVNISRAHFANPNLAEHICELVDAYQVPHHLIEIELTESAFFDDKAALLNIVHKLRELNFEISMDDFGAGYSSLNSLKDLPLDVLKLDAEFFRGEDKENRREIVVSQAIQLAKSLNMRIVAEGVEKKEQVDFLAQQGCDMIQGFYFAKPMPIGEFEEKMQQ